MPAENNAPKSTANAARVYAQRTADVRRLIGILQGQMDRHADAAKADEKNWGFVGDIGYLREKLVEMTCFMGQMDPSQIEALLK